MQRLFRIFAENAKPIVRKGAMLMNRTEFRIFVGIFRQLRYFERLYADCDESEMMEIFECFESEPFTDALEDLTVRIIRHMETLPESGIGCNRRKIS